MRAREAILVQAVRAARRPEDTQPLRATQIGPRAAGLGTLCLERVRQWIVEQPAPRAGRAHVTANDVKGPAGMFLLVFASAFPVVLSFVFMSDVQQAKRVSVANAITMLFRCGDGWGRYGGISPWRAGLVMVVLGVIFEGLVIALGG